MGAKTGIEWCDHTFNPWIGCTRISKGCDECFAEDTDDRRFSKTLGGGTKENPISHWGKGAPRHRTSADNWRQPLGWNKGHGDAPPMICDCCGFSYGSRDACLHAVAVHRPRVFCASLCDWLDPEVLIEWLADLLALIHATPNLDWLLLTKRPHLWKERIVLARRHLIGQGKTEVASWLTDWMIGKPPAQVWLGTSVEDQAAADRRVKHLCRIPARVRFLSVEPMLGAMQLGAWDGDRSFPQYHVPAPYIDSEERWEFFDDGIHWVICGGESGDDARPMHVDWARALRDECSQAQIPFLFKQWGEWIAEEQMPAEEVFCLSTDNEKWHRWADGSASVRYGKKASGRSLDGQLHHAFPNPRPIGALESWERDLRGGQILPFDPEPEESPR